MSISPIEVLAEPVEGLVPELAVVLEERRGVLEGRTLDPRGPQPPVLPARDKPRLLEHLQVLGHRLQRDRERLGELVDRRLAAREPREDLPSGGGGGAGGAGG